MKDSGVEWVGDIPEGWNCYKIDSVYFERNTKVSDKDYSALSVTKQGILPQLESAAKTSDGDNRKLVKKYDFVINSRSDRRGSCGISEYDGSVSLISTVLMPKNNISNKYFNFVFRTERFADEYYRWGHGIVDDLWSTKWSSFKRICICIPPLTKQQKIADYLDEKVTEIENIIIQTTLSIEEYKKYKQSLVTETVTKGLNPDVEMKDSGVEWIGNIPKGCKLSKIKYVTTKIGSGKTPRGGANVYSNEGIMFLRSQNIYNECLSIDDVAYITEEIDETMKNTRVLKDDILLNITGGSIGRATIYPFDNYANVNQHVCIIRVNPNVILNKYLHYVIISNIGYNAINIYQTGANREGLNFQQIGNIAFPYMNFKEQHQIADYLDRKCADIDNLITQKQQLLIELQAYKKSLIFEYVTGKKEVV